MAANLPLQMTHDHVQTLEGMLEERRAECLIELKRLGYDEEVILREIGMADARSAARAGIMSPPLTKADRDRIVSEAIQASTLEPIKPKRAKASRSKAKKR